MKKNKKKLPKLKIENKFIEDMNDWLNGLISSLPESNITEMVSQWAERKRVLTNGITNIPGPFNFDESPYLREIVDCLSEMSSVREVAFMKGTQVGGTVGIIENHMGYCIDYGIGPVLYVSGDQAMAEEQMEKRVDQMIESAGLQDKIRANVEKKHNKSTGDKKESKSYAGTFMRAVGPNSESKLRTFPTKILYLDEVDVYPIVMKNKGNPITKAIRRTDSYETSRKIFYISTPKNEDTSQINPVFQQGDKRYYYIQCPRCKHPQPLVFDQFRWEKDENGKLKIDFEEVDGYEKITNEPVWYECIDCKGKIYEHEKSKFLKEKGRGGSAEWIPTKKPDRPGLRSYHLPAWYGFRQWREIIIQYQMQKDDPVLYQEFVNDVKGEPFFERAEKPDDHKIWEKAEQWDAGYISDKVIFLTLTADIQKDRIEAGLMGWGRNRQSYMIDYWTFHGETHLIESKCWKELYGKIISEYKRSDDVSMRVQIAFIDSQYNKDQVNTFCDQFDYHPNTLAGVYPIIARDAMESGRITKIQKNDIKTPIIQLADQKLKFILYTTLKKEPYADGFPFGYIHFPKTFGHDFYKQLTAEDVYTETKRNGLTKVTIENRKQRRNEVLDIVKYHIGAYQFAIDKYFEIENKKLRENKRPEIQPDNDIFMDVMEGLLYE